MYCNYVAWLLKKNLQNSEIKLQISLPGIILIMFMHYFDQLGQLSLTQGFGI